MTDAPLFRRLPCDQCGDFITLPQPLVERPKKFLCLRCQGRPFEIRQQKHTYTRSEQTLRQNLRGTRHPLAKLTTTTAIYVLMSDLTPTSLARQLGVTAPLVRGIRAGRNWGWL